MEKSSAGVFVGISWTEYARLTGSAGVSVGPYTAQGAVLSVSVGRTLFNPLISHLITNKCY